MTENNKENTKVKFEGLIRWASVPPNAARKPQKDYIDPLAPNNSSYSIEVECDKAKFDKLMKAGIPKLTTLRTDDATGVTYLKIKASKVKRVDGEDLTFADPVVLDKHGQTLTVPIGNGSRGIVIAELAQGKRGKSLRLRAVQVKELIPFVSTGSIDDIKDLLDIEEEAAPFNEGDDGTIEDYL